MIKGFFSKDLKYERFNYLKRIHELIGKSAKDSIGVPAFNIKGPFTTKSKVLFLFEYDKLSVFCVKNNVAEATVLFIQKELEKIIEEEETLSFDFAFIPIEVIE